MGGVMLATDVWSKRRARAEELARRWPFAAEVLGFYGALAEVQEATYVAALDDKPRPDTLAAYAGERVLPRVLELSAASGPPSLVAAVLELFHELDFVDTLTRWLRGAELPAIERYLARAAAGPVLEALGDEAGGACAGPRDAVHCPTCGGVPQLSYFASSPEDLVTAHRYLICSRCAASWAYPRLTCGACGETDTNKLLVYGEIGTAQAEVSDAVVKPGGGRIAPAGNAHFPHVRIDGCETCSQYLLTIDLDRDPRAVPLVDEIAAIPLDLYAKERGLTKVMPNIMGF